MNTQAQKQDTVAAIVENNSVVIGGRTYTHISTDRTYLARIICADLAQRDYTTVLAVLVAGDTFEQVRRCNDSMTTPGGFQFEPIPEVDWTQVEVDTPIWVRTTERDAWVKRHFSKFDPTTKAVYAWNNGYTSHTVGFQGDTEWAFVSLTDPTAKTKTQ